MSNAGVIIAAIIATAVDDALADPIRRSVNRPGKIRSQRARCQSGPRLGPGHNTHRGNVPKTGAERGPRQWLLPVCGNGLTEGVRIAVNPRQNPGSQQAYEDMPLVRVNTHMKIRCFWVILPSWTRLGEWQSQLGRHSPHHIGLMRASEKTLAGPSEPRFRSRVCFAGLICGSEEPSCGPRMHGSALGLRRPCVANRRCTPLHRIHKAAELLDSYRK